MTKASILKQITMKELLYSICHDNRVIKYYDAAIALNKTDSNAYFNRGVFLQTNGDYKGAISSYEKALELNPHDRDAKENLVIAKSQLFKSTCCIGGSSLP